MTVQRVLLLVFLIYNFITCLIMYADKRRAITGKWRIPEKTLFLLAFFFGAPGVLLGMHLFRHKTKHRSFQILVPAALVCNLLCIYLLEKYLFPFLKNFV